MWARLWGNDVQYRENSSVQMAVPLVEGGLIRVPINDNHRNQATYVTDQATHVAYSSGNYVTWLPRVLRHIESQ